MHHKSAKWAHLGEGGRAEAGTRWLTRSETLAQPGLKILVDFLPLSLRNTQQHMHDDG